MGEKNGDDPRAVWAGLGDRLRESNPLLYERVALMVQDLVEAQEALRDHEILMDAAVKKDRWSA